MRIALLVIALCLFGCGTDNLPRDKTHKLEPAINTKIVGTTFSGRFELIETEIDGIECVVMSGYKMGGISCSWEKANKVGTK